MNQASTSLIKIGLLVIGLYLMQSCTNDTCESKIKSELSENEFFTQKKSFVLKSQNNEWLASTNDNQGVIESRYAYKIEVDPDSEIILLNHTQVNQNDATTVLEEEFMKLAERFKNDDLEKLPNVGFQIIYPTKPNTERLSRTICIINQGILEIKSKANSGVDKERFSKLIQPRFSFFPN